MLTEDGESGNISYASLSRTRFTKIIIFYQISRSKTFFRSQRQKLDYKTFRKNHFLSKNGPCSILLNSYSFENLFLKNGILEFRHIRNRDYELKKYENCQVHQQNSVDKRSLRKSLQTSQF